MIAIIAIATSSAIVRKAEDSLWSLAVPSKLTLTPGSRPSVGSRSRTSRVTLSAIAPAARSASMRMVGWVSVLLMVEIFWCALRVTKVLIGTRPWLVMMRIASSCSSVRWP